MIKDKNYFTTLIEFNECIIGGGEPVFEWKGVKYGVCFADEGYCIAHTDGACERIYNTPDELLEYVIGDERLRDIITKVRIISLSI